MYAAVGLEPLDPQVAAVADPDRPVRGDRHGMRRVELAGRGARDAPRPAVGAVGVEDDDPAVAVAVGDVDRAVGRDRDVGRLVERALVRAGDIGRAELHEDLAVERGLEHAMPAGVGQPQRAIGHQAHAVRQVEAQVPRAAGRCPSRSRKTIGSMAGPRWKTTTEPSGASSAAETRPNQAPGGRPSAPNARVGPVAQRPARMGGPGGRRAVDGHSVASPLGVRPRPRTSRWRPIAPRRRAWRSSAGPPRRTPAGRGPRRSPSTRSSSWRA